MLNFNLKTFNTKTKMPKFISGSSGHIYAKDKTKEEEDEILASISVAGSTKNAEQKPSAVNRTREKQKNSLDLFKEELRRINEEREEKRKSLKNSLEAPVDHSSAPRSSIPVPLKPDPRCPTTLTLQISLNPKDKDSSGSFDTGDPSTTNLYIGNLNPTVTESELCDVFGKFGALASIKIMWPRTDEERARNRNSGFVAYMSRIDAERALKALNGVELKAYEMKLGWGKAVPLPKKPVFVPEELIEFHREPKRTGLPFNAQLHEIDIERGYIVPMPWPRGVIAHETTLDANGIVAHREFIEVLSRATVRVRVPFDYDLLARIHKTIEYVLREGPVFEAIIIARESNNPNYRFLYDNSSPEHVYYRWKLYSMLHGDSPDQWPTGPIRMFEGGPIWLPPPLNPFAEGMPLELVERLTGLSRELLASERPAGAMRDVLVVKWPSGSADGPSRLKFSRKFGDENVEKLNEILADLEPTKRSVGAAMLFCIKHSDAAEEVIECFEKCSNNHETPYKVRLAHLYLISDILQNSSASVTNASHYRKAFQAKLVNIFGHLHDYHAKIEDRHHANRLKKKVLTVLDAWSHSQLYERDFIHQLGRIFLGSSDPSPGATFDADSQVREASSKQSEHLVSSQPEAQLDGELLDERELVRCLEERGLSLSWYKTLELSDNEEEGATESELAGFELEAASATIRLGGDAAAAGPSTSARFKASNWEVITTDGDELRSPTGLIGSISTRAVPVRDLSAQKVGSPAYENSPSSTSSSSFGSGRV